MITLDMSWNSDLMKNIGHLNFDALTLYGMGSHRLAAGGRLAGAF